MPSFPRFQACGHWVLVAELLECVDGTELLFADRAAETLVDDFQRISGRNEFSHYSKNALLTHHGKTQQHHEESTHYPRRPP